MRARRVHALVAVTVLLAGCAPVSILDPFAGTDEWRVPWSIVLSLVAGSLIWSIWRGRRGARRPDAPKQRAAQRVPTVREPRREVPVDRRPPRDLGSMLHEWFDVEDDFTFDEQVELAISAWLEESRFVCGEPLPQITELADMAVALGILTPEQAARWVEVSKGPIVLFWPKDWL